jgi:hypothetical protein
MADALRRTGSRHKGLTSQLPTYLQAEATNSEHTRAQCKQQSSMWWSGYRCMHVWPVIVVSIHSVLVCSRDTASNKGNLAGQVMCKPYAAACSCAVVDKCCLSACGCGRPNLINQVHSETSHPKPVAHL